MQHVGLGWHVLHMVHGAGASIHAVHSMWVLAWHALHVAPTVVWPYALASAWRACLWALLTDTALHRWVSEELPGPLVAQVLPSCDPGDTLPILRGARLRTSI